MSSDAQLAEVVMQRIDTLAQITEEPRRLTRTYGSPAMHQANEILAKWMHAAGMTVQKDAIGNLIGQYPASEPHAKTLLLGSHLDTVRDAGKFDGALGVLVALACVQRLHEMRLHLPLSLKVIAFADEEGIRFQSACLGSRAMAGTLNDADLERTDANGISLREAILDFGGDAAALYSCQMHSEELLGYCEVHIEQGPVLESMSLPVGVVSGIAGQTRVELHLTGHAGHAGTTPMAQRRDALAAAAHFVTGVELLARNTPGLVATVGRIEVQPGASNVIPGAADLTVDIRHRDDAIRETACDSLRDLAIQLAAERRLGADWQIVQTTHSVLCSPQLTTLLREAAKSHVPEVVELPSGAGHDAAALCAITPVAMLFVRCKEGISHHPGESVQLEDVRVAIAVMHEFISKLKVED